MTSRPISTVNETKHFCFCSESKIKIDSKNDSELYFVGNYKLDRKYTVQQ